ncbi:hypothetical protein [Algoriphagus sp.]|uniref:hypothetical protein n=1 Tax=Algoriphagus sp. TaxID=1872435 RepID=UPI00391DC4E1
MKSKKIVLVLVLCLFSFLAKAQYKGQWRAIHAYEWKGSNGFFGMNFTAEYFPAHYFSIVPSYTIFLPATGKASSLDLDAHYYLTEKKKQFYGLAGFRSYFFNREFDGLPRQTVNSFSLGAGGMLKINDSLGFNPEIKYSFAPANEVIFKIGVVYFVN